MMIQCFMHCIYIRLTNRAVLTVITSCRYSLVMPMDYYSVWLQNGDDDESSITAV